jgi:cysteine desulfurase/selenocysteine lyase
VIESTRDFYTYTNANVHRGLYRLADEASERFESARETIARFLKTPSDSELIFTAGTTDSLNIAANGIAETLLDHRSEIWISPFEHHANLVTWQNHARRQKATLRKLPTDRWGVINLPLLEKELESSNSATKVVCIKHVCNVLGTIQDLESIGNAMARLGAITVVDGAQAPVHLEVDLGKSQVDFYATGAHKMYGPMGIGALVGKRSLLEKISPMRFGGNMIQSVTFESTEFADLPARFEAGTPNAAGAIAWAAAIDFINEYRRSDLHAHEQRLAEDAAAGLESIMGVKVLGCGSRAPIVSFVVAGVHPHDIAGWLDQSNVAVRAGAHCCHPLMTQLGEGGTTRASFAPYNTLSEVDSLVKGVADAVRRLRT